MFQHVWDLIISHLGLNPTQYIQFIIRRIWLYQILVPSFPSVCSWIPCVCFFVPSLFLLNVVPNFDVQVCLVSATILFFLLTCSPGLHVATTLLIVIHMHIPCLLATFVSFGHISHRRLSVLFPNVLPSFSLLFFLLLLILLLSDFIFERCHPFHCRLPSSVLKCDFVVLWVRSSTVNCAENKKKLLLLAAAVVALLLLLRYITYLYAYIFARYPHFM